MFQVIPLLLFDHSFDFESDLLVVLPHIEILPLDAALETTEIGEVSKVAEFRRVGEGKEYLLDWHHFGFKLRGLKL